MSSASVRLLTSGIAIVRAEVAMSSRSTTRTPSDDCCTPYTDAADGSRRGRAGCAWTDDARWELGPHASSTDANRWLPHWQSSLADQHVVQLHRATPQPSTAMSPQVGPIWRTECAGLRTPAIFVGWYDDRYRRTAGGWRFSRRALTRLVLLVPPISPAILRLRTTQP